MSGYLPKYKPVQFYFCNSEAKIQTRLYGRHISATCPPCGHAVCYMSAIKVGYKHPRRFLFLQLVDFSKQIFIGHKQFCIKIYTLSLKIYSMRKASHDDVSYLHGGMHSGHMSDIGPPSMSAKHPSLGFNLC